MSCLPTSLEDCFFISKLDISNAYLQLPLHETSQQYVTIHTHKGLFKYNRFPFGVASAPAIFQWHIWVPAAWVGWCHCIHWWHLITGTTLEEHFCNLEAVLKCLEEVDLHLNQDKCFYLCPYIECLAHLIDKDGIHPTQVKVQAIKEGPAPTNQLNYIHFWVWLTITTSSYPI